MVTNASMKQSNKEPTGQTTSGRAHPSVEATHTSHRNINCCEKQDFSAFNKVPHAGSSANSSNMARIATWNVYNAHDDMTLAGYAKVCKDKGIAIMAIQETKRTQSAVIEDFVFSSKQLDGMRFIGMSSSKKVGGVGFIVNSNLGCVVDDIINNEQEQNRILTILCNLRGLRLKITNIYSLTESYAEESKTRFYNTVNRHLLRLDQFKRYKTIILGDFNSVIGSDSTDFRCCGGNNPNQRETSSNGLRLLKMCDSRELRILNTFYRCKRRHRGTHYLQTVGLWRRLDYICTTQAVSKLVKSCRGYTGRSRSEGRLMHGNFTDHNPVIAVLQVPSARVIKQIHKRRGKRRKKRDISELSFGSEKAKAVQAEIEKQLADFSSNGTVDEMSSQLKKAIHLAMDVVLPESQRAKTRPIWENEEYTQLLAASKDGKKSCSERRRFGKLIKQMKIKLKSEYYATLANSINQARINRAIEREFSQSKKFNLGGRRREDPYKFVQAKRFGEHFSQHFRSDPAIGTPPEVENFENLEYLHDKPVEIDQSPPTAGEISTIMRKFRNGKSWGQDQIPMEVLKYCCADSPIILDKFECLHQTIWDELEVPREWLESTISVIYKKKSRSEPINYRGISLTANLSRILPSVALGRLKEHYETNLSPHQFGFRSDYSTIDCLFVFNQMLRSLSSRLTVTYIDFSAAFDKLSRELTWRIIGLRTGAEKLSTILELLYKNTHATMADSDVRFEVLGGTRQGAIESPPAFCYVLDFVLKIVANEIDKRFPDGVEVGFQYELSYLAAEKRKAGRAPRGSRRLNGREIVRWLLYADDLTMIVEDPAVAKICTEILSDVCKRYGLYVSLAKTNTQVFRDENLAKKDTLFTLDSTKIQNVTDFKLLGHTISNTDKSAFVAARISSATAQFNIYRNLFTDRNVENSSKIRFLEAYVRSRLTYAIQSCVPSEEDYRKLAVAWYSFLRQLTPGGRARKTKENGENDWAFKYSNKEIENYLGTPPIRDFMHVQFLNYIAHIIRRPNSHPTKRAHEKNQCHSIWRKVTFLLGITKDDAIRKMQNKCGFKTVLAARFPYLATRNRPSRSSRVKPKRK